MVRYADANRSAMSLVGLLYPSSSSCASRSLEIKEIDDRIEISKRSLQTAVWLYVSPFPRTNLIAYEQVRTLGGGIVLALRFLH